MTALWCTKVLLPTGWADGVRLELDGNGMIVSVETGAPPDGCTRVDGIVLPGMPNLHSHAFQRAMAGLAERVGPSGSGDSFWTWRKAMYGFVGALDPDDVEAIATQLYVEMAEAGYTSVAEFHYLHNTPDGTPYADPAELSRRLQRAAEAAGLRLTLLPVLYQSGGFGGQPVGDAQRRFFLETDTWLSLIDILLKTDRSSTLLSTGIALHSLRAVPPDSLLAALEGYDRLRPDGPIHIHIAEQTKEVEECVSWSGARPVDWLLDHAPVDGRWCLVHATHMTEAERRRMAATGAVAGLCPTTEANLGDGIFPLPEWRAERGVYGVGSDSNVALDPREELRWLEYAQRLTRRARVVSLAEPGASVGAALWREAAAGGAAALGEPAGGIAPGKAADLVVLDPDHPSLAGRDGDVALDAWIFAAIGSALTEVWVGGRRIVEQGRHPGRTAAAEGYRQALRRLAERF